MPESVEMSDLLATRRKTYGDFSVHASATQGMEEAFYVNSPQRKDQYTAVQQEALHMIFHKLGRIAAGDPGFKDHWADIAGYALLAAEACD